MKPFDWNEEKNNWLKSALKTTVVPFIVIMIFFMIAGYIFQNVYEDAITIGDVITKISKSI